VENFDDLLAAALADGDEAVMIDVTAHAHCYGRPAGAWAFEAIAGKVRARDDVWLVTRAEMAEYVIATWNETPIGSKR
jgi:hypothetical protein